LKKGISDCLAYLQSIKVEQSMEREEGDYVMTTNCGIERLFGSLKQTELTKFNMNSHTLSALQCLKDNHALESLTKMENWEAIHTMAINERAEVVENIEKENIVLKEARLNKITEHLKEEHKKNEKMEEENFLLCINSNLVPFCMEDLDDCFQEWKKEERSWMSHRNQLSKTLYVKVLIGHFYSSIHEQHALIGAGLDKLEGEKLLGKLIDISKSKELLT
jgi:hypothetical protein